MFDLCFGPARPSPNLMLLRPSFLTSHGICVWNLRFGPIQFAFWAYLARSGCVLEVRFENIQFPF